MAALAASSILAAGCDERPAERSALSTVEQEAANAGYLSPPGIQSVEVSPEGLVVRGTGPAGGRVRLIDSGRRVHSTGVNAAGTWRVQAPITAEPHLFTVLAEQQGRELEAEGRLLVLPGGRALVLRPGHGALPVAERPEAEAPTIVSIDVASDGAAAVSGYAQPSSRAVTVVDGAPPAEDLVVGQGAADRDGRFAVILASPLAPGPHTVVVNTPEGVARAEIDVAPAADPGFRPFAAERAGSVWRIDWRLPRGGVQTTYVLGDGA